jgi:hypothetical protein
MDRRYLLVYFTCLQPSTQDEVSGQENPSYAEQNTERETSVHDECCTKKLKSPPPTYQNPRPVATNNFFAPLRDLPMENAETGSEGNSTKTPGTYVNSGKCRPSPIVLTSEAKFVGLHGEVKNVVSGGFFRINYK